MVYVKKRAKEPHPIPEEIYIYILSAQYLENQDLKDHFLKKKILSPEIRISSIDVYLFT